MVLSDPMKARCISMTTDGKEIGLLVAEAAGDEVTSNLTFSNRSRSENRFIRMAAEAANEANRDAEERFRLNGRSLGIAQDSLAESKSRENNKPLPITERTRLKRAVDF